MVTISDSTNSEYNGNPLMQRRIHIQVAPCAHKPADKPATQVVENEIIFGSFSVPDTIPEPAILRSAV